MPILRFYLVVSKNPLFTFWENGGFKL